MIWVGIVVADHLPTPGRDSRAQIQVGGKSLSILSLRPAAVRLAGASAVAIAVFAASQAQAATTPAAEAPAAPAAADAPAPDGTATGGTLDIVVTAQHRNERLQDVPSAVTALGGAQFLQNDLGRSASDVLYQVPNATADTQQHGRPRWWIRGVGAGQQQLDLSNPVGFYLDDVYISDASATGIPLYDIQRVEVLRGPQGTLWGKNTTGGAINIISEKPKFTGDQDNYVKLEYGSYDDKIAEGGIGTVLIPDLLTSRVSFHIDDRGGRFTNLYTGQKADSYNDDNVRVQFLARPADNLDALLSFHYRRYNTEGDLWTVASYRADGAYRYTTPTAATNYTPSTNIDDIDENSPVWSHNAQVGGNLHLDWHLGGGTTLSAISGYERYDTTAVSDSDYTPLEGSVGYTKAYSSQWTQELRLTSPQTGKLTWIAGLFYFNEKIHSDAATADLPSGSVPAQGFIPSSSPYSLIDYEHKTESGAAYGSATYAFTDALKLTGGLRWTRETKTLDFDRLAAPSAASASWSNYAQWWNSYTGAIGGSGTFSNRLRNTWDALTYDITPAWHIDRNNLIYFKYAHGVKSGGFNTAAAAPVALIAVAPERLNSYEGGYKSTWFGGKLTADATVFHYDYRNIQVNVVGPNPAVAGASVSYLQNAAKGHANGAEFDLAASPVDRLKLTASAGLLYTRFDSFTVVNSTISYAGNQFVRSPHLTLNGGASYTVPLAKAGTVELEADARYTSLQYYYVNVQDNVNRYLLDQPAYTLANARVTWTAPSTRLSASVYVDNFLNTVYRSHALPGYVPATGVYGDIVQYGDPRTIGGSLIYRF